MEICMMGNGRKGLNMDGGGMHLPMEIYMRECGGMAKGMEKESISGN
jgi:hypothetical protein